MDLLKDNQNLKSQYFLEPTEKKSLETKSLEVTFTPTNEDTGKDLVCRAKLLVDEIDIEYEKRETTEKLQVYSKCLCNVVKSLWEFCLGCIQQYT